MPEPITSATWPFGRSAVQAAMKALAKGEPALDAALAGAQAVEDDTSIRNSVGFGSLPDRLGRLTLDACLMDGRTLACGAVACVEHIRHVAALAKRVMEKTPHVLLVGEAAKWFALQQGFPLEVPYTAESIKEWLDAHPAPKALLRLFPNADEQTLAWAHEMAVRPPTGTINCLALNEKGEMSGCTTTSGLAWKIPGRVGDSPILGAGLYVDVAIGAAGSTGRGEANLYNLSSYLICEAMRQGRHPKDACLEALRRIRANTIERRLRKPNGDPNFNITFYAINAKGEHAAVAMYAEDDNDRGWAGQTDGRLVRYALCTQDGPKTLPCDGLIPGALQDNA